MKPLQGIESATGHDELFKYTRGARCVYSAQLQLQVILSVGFGIEGMISDPARPITVHFEHPTDRLAESLT